MTEKAQTNINKKVFLGIPIYFEKKEKEEPHLFHLKGIKIFFIIFIIFLKLLHYLKGVDRTTLW